MCGFRTGISTTDEVKMDLKDSKTRSALNTAKNGFIIGSSMLVPGVSGGTMALILGIYDRLIHAINSIFKDFKKSFFFLLQFCIGAGLGFLVFGKAIGWALESFEVPVRYLFTGAVLGGLPLLFRKSTVKKSGKDIAMAIISFVLGAAVVFAISFLPKTTAFSEIKFDFGGILLLLLTGIIIAVALVLPGISTSHMLIIMGVYYTIIEHPLQNLGLIAVLGISTIIGILIITRFLEFLLNRFPVATYFCIIGFVLGSLKQLLFNDEKAYYVIPQGFEWVVAILAAALGFAATYFLSKREAKSEG